MNQISHESLRQPKALYLLFFVKMWECFSFYGMRALMILYLIKELGFEDSRAYGIYAIYCSLVEFGGLLGGRFADCLLGLRKTIALGGWLIAAGHLLLSFQTQTWLFFSGLALIVVGSGLFSTNISAFLGLFYQENDPRREAGFTLFYVGINVGALLATLMCGIIGEVYGWHYGFGLAAIGMILGNGVFHFSTRIFEGKGEAVQTVAAKKKFFFGYLLLLMAIPLAAFMINGENVVMPFIPFFSLLGVLYLGRKMVLSGKFSNEKLVLLGIYLGALALFFAAEDQTATLLLVFSERHATGAIAGIPIPTTVLLSLNPFVIIGGGFLMSKFKMTSYKKDSWFVSMGLMIAALVFAVLAATCHFSIQEGKIPMLLIVLGIMGISLGEVILAPAIFSYCSEISPPAWLGTTMGLIPLGFSLGNVISGFLSQSIEISGNPLESYSWAFGKVSLVLLGMTSLVFLGSFMINKRNRAYDCTF